MKKFLKLFLPLALCLAIVGCTSKTYVVHPGAVNTFDSQAYDSVFTADQAIQNAKASLIAGTLPPAAKPILNKVIQSYNVADAAYIAYHNVAASGGDTTALAATLGADLSQLAIDISNLAGVKK